MKEMKHKNILKILLITAVMVLSTIDVVANTTNDQTLIASANPDKSADMTDRNVLLFENFDGTWEEDPDPDDPYMVPPCWDIDGICIASQAGYFDLTHYWSQFDDRMLPLTHSAPYCAGVWWSDGSGPDYPGLQDEWLIMPELNVANCLDLQLEFYSVYTMYTSYPGIDAHDYVKVSTDGGVTWDIVGDLSHDTAFYFPGANGGPGGRGWNWNEFPVVIDLSIYDGSDSLIIAFHYVVEDPSQWHGCWMVDDVELIGEGEIYVPDLDCDGNLSWSKVKPGSKVIGSFTVENIGDPGSELDWEIESYPDWGTWTFTPSSGNDLTPEDDTVTVSVSVVAPDEADGELTGQVKIINSNDPDDFCIIDATMKKSANQNSFVLQFLERLIHRFPILERMLSSRPFIDRILSLK